MPTGLQALSGAAALAHTFLLTRSGSLAVGYILAWGLYGVLAVQIYIYYLAFSNDRVVSKILVTVVCLLETLQVVVIARDMFEVFVKGFGSPNAITELHLSGLSAPIIGGVESIIVPLLVCLMAVIQCVGAFISGVRGFIGGDIRNLDTMTDRVGHGLFNATSAACDIVIAIAMSYYVSLPKFDAGIRGTTHALVRRIIRLVVGTGMLTAAVVILDQVLYQVFPHKGYFLAPAFVLGKLYSNSMMVIFNSRVDFGSYRDRATIHITTNDTYLTHGGIRAIPGQSYNPESRFGWNASVIELDICAQKVDPDGRPD
ncbi:hypothetical protein P691DRAFT_780569 [Macrolepiota fuliginosa MF-IS2]|uniref:DUF6534 domain-containing protein n=1 Tax=Macrolepiota fuliginosa MF-IS2 TaxID=1400762 RepID=A0A9P6C508_9AGAR|nr:hypothetical protein P691DRAFT_780569 [Macrolepiota fuliginosa MF-IS2]